MNSKTDMKQILKNLTLLYVEDDEITIEVVENFLKDKVKELYIAHDGKEGLATYKEKNPDIILTDINMPKLNGLEMAKEIKKIDQTQPIIILAAEKEASQLHQSVDIGINAYITKPVHLQKMLESLVQIASRLQDEFEREALQGRIENNSKFYRIVSDISLNFLKAFEEDFDNEIDAMLAEVGNHFQVDRSFIFLFSDDLTTIPKTYEWCNKGIQSHKDNLQNQAIDSLPWIKKQILNRDIVHIPNVENLPKEAMAKKSDFESRSIKSMIVVPIKDRNKVFGFIGLESVKKLYKWSETEIYNLKIILNVLSNFLHHIDVEKTLKYAYEEKNKILEKALEQKEQFELAVAGSNDGIWDWNLTNNKLFLSKRWKEMLGYEENEIKNVFESFLSLIHQEDFQRVQEHAQEYLEGNLKKYEIEFRMKHKNGSDVWVLAKGKGLRDKNGTVYRMAGSNTNITKRKKDEKALQDAKAEAEKTTKHKSEFLANMSHEIRTPLNAILGFVDLLKEKTTEPESKKYLDIIDSSSHHLLGVINDILDFSKLESGKIEIDNIDFDVHKEFDTIYQLFNAKVSEKNIDLVMNIDSSLPPVLVADPLRLKQVIANLLSNSIKFTQSDKKIYLTFSYSDEMLHVIVKDEGVGIAKEKQKKIFEAFSQADSSTTREFGGTGLGLTISSELVRLMGGELSLKSELGEGSEFYFCIPAVEGKLEVLDAKQKTYTIFKGKKILLVEDNKSNQMFMQIVLKKLDVEFEIANDGLEAVEMFKNKSYDATLMDENMPNMNGIEATKQILAIENERNQKHTPIIALTANALKGDREKFLDAKMDEYLTKPVDMQKLQEVMSKFLGAEDV